MGCRHDAAQPYAGCRIADHTADTVVFACPSCGATYEALRCAAISKRTGERCRLAALTGGAGCQVHRKKIAAGLIGTVAP